MAMSVSYVLETIVPKTMRAGKRDMHKVLLRYRIYTQATPQMVPDESPKNRPGGSETLIWNKSINVGEGDT